MKLKMYAIIEKVKIDVKFVRANFFELISILDGKIYYQLYLYYLKLTIFSSRVKKLKVINYSTYILYS